MTYPFFSLTAVIVFSLVHLVSEKIQKLNFVSHSRLLSAGGGVAISYVFIDLLPKLSESDALVKKNFFHIFPYFERHVFILALIGFLTFFIVHRSQKLLEKKSTYFWLSISSYSLFNFLVGYAVADKDNPEVRPLLLFSFAMALHYFMNDYSLSEAHKEEYRNFGRWILIVALFLGWLLGIWIELSPTAVALVSAFIAGGVIMNVTRYELPSKNPHSLGAFLLSCMFYTVLLLSIG